MLLNGKIVYGKCGEDFKTPCILHPSMANRHGFIGGATGTGKTVTLKVLAESFSALGVPVFLSDVKGDLAGMVNPGLLSENLNQRIDRYHLDEDGFEMRSFPVTFYDLYGKNGIPLRTTVSEMGPQLMSQILNLNETQSAVLTVIYKMADDQGLILDDAKDLKAALQFAQEHNDELQLEYGNISKASAAAIVRAIVALEAESTIPFFAEPALDIRDFFTTDANGAGMISILDAQSLINRPRLYCAFMLYLLSELFELLPEVGDLEKPKMVFFFDEAHLLFSNGDNALLEKVEQVVKLIRSKGVGIYFISQSPKDIPSSVMSQLSNKIEHALRAYTPAEQKALKAASDSFRVNPEFDTETLLQELATGEAVVSMLDESGIPEICQHGYILPPQSQMGPIDDSARRNCIVASPLYLKYAQIREDDSAYEFLERRKKEQLQQTAVTSAKRKKMTEGEKAMKSALRSTGTTVGREVGQSIGKVIGGTFGKKLGGNVGASLGRSLFGNFFKNL